MENKKLYGRLAVERCRFYIAQLSATHHFSQDGKGADVMQGQTVRALLSSLEDDITILKELLD